MKSKRHFRSSVATRLGCETLEIRSLLSNLVPTLASPSAGSLLFTSPRTLVVTFNTPIDPSTLSSPTPGGPESDIELYRIDSHGNLNSLIVSGIVPASESLDPNHPESLIVTLGQPLNAGNYQVTLSTNSFIAGLDGSNDPNLFTGDDPLGTFSIVTPPQVSLATAIPLPAIGSSVHTATGSLNFATNPESLGLYKFSLSSSTPGTNWRVGLQVQTTSVGSALSPTLALFNAQGTLIATAQSGPGNDLSEPFLFAGLPSGTYYVGVSDHANLPGSPGGYNPATGFPGSNSPTSASGSFVLDYVADPNPKPTKLTSFTIHRADPWSTQPTGFSLQFSGALGFDGLHGNLYDGLSTAIQVVDQNGGIHSVTLTSFNELTSSLTYVFNSSLPAGRYTVVLPTTHGLTDLVQRAPIALNQPAGVLGVFQVAPSPANTDPFDLGILYPTAFQGQGVQTSTTLPVGIASSTTFRFVVTIPGVYQLSANSSGPVTFYLTSAGGGVPITKVFDASQSRPLQLQLSAGEYFLRITSGATTPSQSAANANPASAGVSVAWSLALLSADSESAIQLGIDPGTALNLRLISPTSADVGVSSNVYAAPFPVSIAVIGPNGFANPAVPASNGSGLPGTPPLLPGLALTFSGFAVGRPSVSTDQVLAVGPGGAGNSVALAALSAIPKGIDHSVGEGQEPDSQGMEDVVAATTTDEDIAAVVAQTDRRKGLGNEEVGSMAPPSSEPNLGSVVQTPQAFDAKSWLASVAEWFAAPAGSATESATAMTPVDTTLAEAEPASESDKGSGRAEHASLASPIGMGLLAIVMYQSRDRIARWFGKGTSGGDPQRLTRTSKGGRPVRPHGRV